MIVTISRQYGAGGRTVARGLAEKLGIEFYDIDFVRMTAKLSGYSEEDVRREGEDMSSGMHFINHFLSTNAYNSSYDAIFEAQREVILDLAKKPCIIVGRCSNMILKQAGIESFDIFLYADKEHRKKRALELGENGKTDIDKYIEKRDRLRNTYYHAYTGHEMGNSMDYNICMDTGAIGMDKCTEILAEILKDKI